MRKTLFIILTFVFAPFLALADTSSTISLGSDFNGNVWSNVQVILTGLGPQIEMIIGVILAAVVIEIIIGAMKK